MFNIKNCAIFGTGEASKIAFNWAKEKNIEVLYYIDDYKNGEYNEIAIIPWKSFIDTFQYKVDTLLLGAYQLGAVEYRKNLDIPLLKVPHYYYNKSEIIELFSSLGNSRYRTKEVELFNKTFQYVDEVSFKWMLKEIFIDESYKFKSDNESVIYDIGANVGVSTLFFRHNYPNAKIIAFEADKNIYKVLKNNLKFYDNIEIINKAVWNQNGFISFNIEGSDSGKIDNNGSDRVETVKLLDLLDKEVEINLLKMDIEGAEIEVFTDISSQLNKIENIIMEYHYENNSNRDKLVEILIMFKENNFKYYLETVNSRTAPLYNDSNNSFFSQINIYATKKD